MDTVEMNAACPQEDQEDNIMSPSEDDVPPVSNETSAPLNFSDLTPCQFGISIQSFTPASSNRKDKSRLAQIKARRKSSIGARGSPETNSLIRFMAQQRMKTPPVSQTPELVRSSPLLPRVASTLKQKMASFQSLMDVEESDACDPVPTQDSNTGGCIKTRDYLSDGNSHGGGKENNPPMKPTPSKRRRLGPLEGCNVEIREASTHILHSSLTEQEAAEELVMQVVPQGPLPSSETVEEAQAVFITPPICVNFELKACSLMKNHQDGVFELQSPSRPPPVDPAAASPPQRSSPFHLPSFPSLLEMKPTGEDDSTETSAVKKKKRVRFGGPLSPEFFDKNLPPSTPLQKGGTPARAPTPGGSLQLRSVLKTPQRNESMTPQSQPDLSSPTLFASPTLAMSFSCRMRLDEEETEEKEGKIVFPSMEEIDSAVTNDTECTWDSQPLNLNTAFHEESLSQTLTEADCKSSTILQMDVLDEYTPSPEKEEQPKGGAESPAPARSSNRRKKPGPEREPASEAPARSSSRKRKANSPFSQQPEESEPVKRSTRSAAKSASGKMKITSAAARRWNKDVNRSLYGSREYASKNPTLSPITERLSSISQSPAAEQTASMSYTAPNQETHLNPEMANNTQVIDELAMTTELGTASQDSLPSPNSSQESASEKDRRLSGPSIVRRLKKRKVSVPDSDLLIEDPQDQPGGKTEEHCEDQTTTSLEVSWGTPSKHTVPEQGEGFTEELCAQTSAYTACTDPDGKSECHASLHAPTSDCPPSAEESSSTEPAQRKAKRGRRSSAHNSVLQEQQNQPSREVEKGQADQAASQQENNHSSSDSLKEGGQPCMDLAPWQGDFNFEDVFKPVATRGQRSVRRSLRNRSNVEHSSNSAGLTWLPQTSPDYTRDRRKSTRARRLSAALPVQPSFPEEPQDAS